MATSDDQAGFARAERDYKEFISDPAKLRATRDHVARLQRLPRGEERDSLLHGLKGWLALFEAHIIDNDEGRSLMRAIIDAEAALFASKREFNPHHINERSKRGCSSVGSQQSPTIHDCARDCPFSSQSPIRR